MFLPFSEQKSPRCCNGRTSYRYQIYVPSDLPPLNPSRVDYWITTMTASATPAPYCFQMEIVADLIGPVAAIVEDLLNDMRPLDLGQPDVRNLIIAGADNALLQRVTWAMQVPHGVRQALISRVLRGYGARPRAEAVATR